MMLLNGCVLIDGALGEIKTAAGWASHNTLAIWQGSPPGTITERAFSDGEHARSRSPVAAVVGAGLVWAK